jgi:hypothetical protein
MKKFLILIMLLCGINAMAQENAASLPELQEWYSWKGSIFNTGGRVSYLPGFDSVGGGLNAITQHRNGKDIVWYNRFPFDTTSQFQWKSGGAYAVFQFDANGDGIPDYFDNKGRVYQGIKGQKPESEPAIILSRGGTLKPLIGDLNNDGYDDILAYNDRDYFDVILGNKDISDMTRVTITYPMKESIYVGGYFSESGKPRIILFNDWGSFESFTIYAVTITYTGNQPSVSFEQLDSIEKSKGSSDEKLYEICCNYFYWNKRTGQNYLVLSPTMKPGETRTNYTGYTITNDKFVFLRENAVSGGSYSYLSGSVDGDDEEDFITWDNFKINDKEFIGCAIYSGLPLHNPYLAAYFPRNFCGYIEWLSYIGDVNNDGIGDIAFGGSDGCFAVYLGLDWRTVNVNSVAQYNSFKLHQNIPNPVQKDRKTLLPVSLKQQGNYSIVLYSLQGSRIKDLFNGELSEGEHKIPLDLMGLSAGMYIVKMSTGAVSRERAIMIGE